MGKKKISDKSINMGILINEPGYIEYYSGLKNLELLAGIKDIVTTDHIRKVMQMVVAISLFLCLLTVVNDKGII